MFTDKATLSSGSHVIRSVTAQRLIPLLYHHKKYGPSRNGSARHAGTPHHLHFVISGEATWTGHDVEVQLRSGGIYLAFGGSNIIRHTSTSLVSYGLVFNYELIPGVDMLAEWKRPAQIGEWDVATDREAWDPIRLNAAQAWLIIATAEAALLRYGGSRLAKVIDEHRLMEGRFGSVFSHIKDQLNANMRVEELADIAGMHRSAFTRAFREVTSRSPKAYLSDLIIRQAIREQLTNDRWVKDIAHDLGFGDEYHFIRFFSKRVGEPPGRFRDKRAAWLTPGVHGTFAEQESARKTAARP